MTSARRLIEVDLPIREISAHARREKSIRHGHISTLHIWWARRPLAACRAVVLAALLPDPADRDCPEAFRTKAAEALRRFRDAAGGPPVNDTPEGLRQALLDFIARFANWDASTDPVFLECSRSLVAAASPDGPPLVVDPFAGGGAIPLEALRVGAEAWAGDYNPVAALLLKVVLEDIPRYGERLAEGVRTWGAWIKERVEADLGRFYPPDADGAVPIAYLWSRTVTCEGPGCGAEIPLLRQLWLARKTKRQVALRLVVDAERKHVDFEVVENPSKVGEGTVKRGSAICPVCHFVTPVARVRAQAKANGGLPVRMIAVVRTYPGQQGRHYRVATERDVEVAQEAEEELRRREKEHKGPLSLVPDESLAGYHSFVNRPSIYGYGTWGDLFLPRQALALSAIAASVRKAHERSAAETGDLAFARAVAVCLALALDRQADYLSTLCRWHTTRSLVVNTFGRQAIPMVWDFAETNPLSGSTGDWAGAVQWIEKVCLHGAASGLKPGQATQADARELALPDASVPCLVTDPPYYYSVQYADLSDFFYVWLRRSVGHLYPEPFAPPLIQKDGELIVQSPAHERAEDGKNRAFYERGMAAALAEARRITTPDGIAVVVFAHTSTSGWESMVQALIETGWAVTGSWPLDTEMQAKVHGQGRSLLASSVHIVCRPRPKRSDAGDWRQVRGELERRVAEWLPRLRDEGIEGADAIFACLGPALEVYSRFERVETASGDPVPLAPPEDKPDAPAFLPAVWAAVAREALRMIFEGPEAEGFEEDARLTALWLWTLRAAANGKGPAAEEAEEVEEDEEEAGNGKKKLKGLALDYDTARKLAQALGAHLEDLGKPGGIVEVKKGAARLLPVAERRKTLLGEGKAPKKSGTLFEPADVSAFGPITPGETTLNRLHQAMLLFSDGRGEALRRLLAEPGYTQDGRFRRLAQALSSLYPSSSPEKRWIDGVIGVMRQSRSPASS